MKSQPRLTAIFESSSGDLIRRKTPIDDHDAIRLLCLREELKERVDDVDIWEDASAYESYVGRWSRLVAKPFIEWLAQPAGSAWLDFGCGSGALTETILAEGAARLVVGCDQSSGYVDFARRHTTDPRANFVVAGLSDLPTVDGGFDACVAGLVLNFLPNPADGIAALATRVRPGGMIAAYVWDYADGMQLMRAFWDAAVTLDPVVQARDEGVRFPLCRPGPLCGLFEDAGLQHVQVRAIDVPTVFQDFADYWRPFLGGQGPAPTYLMSLPPEHREQLRAALERQLPSDSDGCIPLVARAWAIRGVRET
jgi:2-polyprenyl-3-methyl-5-hydroxy-6-metoxy-1,4-benzoquinol methylase